MRCWIFNEDQLREALDRWVRAQVEAGRTDGRTGLIGDKCATIHEFLDSDAARDAKIVMDASDKG